MYIVVNALRNSTGVGCFCQAEESRDEHARTSRHVDDGVMVTANELCPSPLPLLSPVPPLSPTPPPPLLLENETTRDSHPNDSDVEPDSPPTIVAHAVESHAVTDVKWPVLYLLSLIHISEPTRPY